MNRMIWKTVVFLMAGCISNLAFLDMSYGGAWVAKRGEMYNKFGVSYFSAHEGFDEQGRKDDFEYSGEYEDINLNYYAEYGFTGKCTLITSLYYKYLKYEDDNLEVETYGIGDIDLGIKMNLFEGNEGIVSIQGLIKVPEAYDEDHMVALGNGQYDGELRLLYGRSLRPAMPGYCNFEIGYRIRDEEPADELRYLIEFGVDFPRDLYGRIKLDGIMGMENESNDESGTGNPSATKSYDLGKLDMTLGCKISSNWFVEIGYAPLLYGENTAFGATYSFAFIFMN